MSLINKLKLLSLFSLLCSSAFAFNVEPGVKLPPIVMYSCNDADLEPIFVKQFAKWNDACGNYFTLKKWPESSTPINIVISKQHLEKPYLAWTSLAPGGPANISIQWPLLPAYDIHDVDTIMLHEIGHTLGLEHVKDTASIMDAVVVHGQSATLSDDDIKGVNSIYHADEKSTLTIRVIGHGRSRVLRITGNIKVDWDFGDGAALRNSFLARHKFTARGEYFVTVRHGLSIGWVYISISK